MFVSSIEVSYVGQNSCLITKLVKDLIVQGPKIVLFKKSDGTTHLESRLNDIWIPFEGWRLRITSK